MTLAYMYLKSNKSHLRHNITTQYCYTMSTTAVGTDINIAIFWDNFVATGQRDDYYYSHCWHRAKVESGRPPAAAAGCVNHRPPQLCTVADVKAEYRRPSRPDLGFQGPCHSALVPTLPTSCLWPPFVRSDLVTKNPGGQAPPTKQRLANANIDWRTSLIQFFKHGH